MGRQTKMLLFCFSVEFKLNAFYDDKNTVMQMKSGSIGERNSSCLWLNKKELIV